MDIRYGYADTPLGQIHYREAGDGPPVLLIHETPLSGATFEFALPALAPHVRAIAPDIPGYGSSPAPPSPLTIPEYARRLGLTLDALGLEHAAIVGGHTGGALALHIAVDMPERVSGVIVLGCPLFTKDQGRAMLERVDLGYRVSKDGSHLDAAWSYVSRFLGPDATEAYYDIVTRAFIQAGERFDWAFKAIFQFDLHDLLPRVSCPTLYLVTEGDFLRNKNEESVALTPKGEGKILNLPHGELYARHPETFKDEVLDYFRRIGFLGSSLAGSGLSYQS